MKVLLLGNGTDSFLEVLDAAGIRYEKHTPRPPPGTVWNAWGDVLQFVGHTIPWASIATVLVAWIRARAARKIIITTKTGKVIHADGFSVKEFEKIFTDAKEVAIIDVKKSKAKK